MRRWESISRLTAGVLYVLAGRRQRPIEIQRSFGVRRTGLRLPAPVARAAGWTLGLGLAGSATQGDGGENHGCVLIRARRR